jgi:hypothetical protein
MERYTRLEKIREEHTGTKETTGYLENCSIEEIHQTKKRS